MLKYWYSQECSRQSKLMVSIVTVAVTFYFSEISKLFTTLTLLSLLLGILVHLLYSGFIKIQPEYPYRSGLKILFSMIPLLGWLILFLQLPNEDKIAQALQILGFSLIGFYIVSIYGNRTARRQY